MKLSRFLRKTIFMKNKKQLEEYKEEMAEALTLALADKLEQGTVSIEEAIGIIQLFLYQMSQKK